MKILRVYIENFGKLTKQEFNFNDGLNTIIEENGYGKSTLATFIKAMFYGMKSTTKKLLDENERRKFTPWQGGNYGGFLEFKMGEKEYRVERFFGKKDSEDSFSVIDLKTGKKTDKFTEKLGEELFGIDEESYERSTFIPQKEIESGISDKLSLKLINMVQGTENKDSFETAINKIKEKSSELKKRGNLGKIAEVENEINEISEQIDALKNSVDTIDSFNESLREEDEIINQLINEKKKVSNNIKAFAEKQQIIANKKYIEEKLEAKKRLEENVKQNEELINNSKVTADELNKMLKKNEEVVELKARVKSLEESISSSKIQELENEIGENKVDAQYVDEIIKKVEKVKEINSKIEQNKNNQTVKKKGLARNIVLPAILSLICFVVGIILIKQTIPCILAFAAFGILMIFSIVLYLKNYIDAKTTVVLNNKQDNTSFIKEKETFEIEIDSFIKLYKIKNDSNLIFELYDLRSKIKEFDILENEINKKKEVVNSLKGTLSTIENQIELFFNQFKVQKELSINNKVSLIKNAINDIKKSKKELDELNIILKDYKTDESLGIDVVDLDISKLQEEEKQIQHSIDIHKDKKTELIRKIDKIKNFLIELDDLETQLAEKIEKRNELKNQYKTFTLVNDFLTLANDNLTMKYKKPMQDNLNKYLKIALKDKYKKFDIDTNLKVSFEEYGMNREVDYLSKGLKGVVNMGIRFALIDSLFEKEKPFVILDDPFVNFDKDKIQNSLQILEDFSKEYQLIYFTCHESRCRKNTSS